MTTAVIDIGTNTFNLLIQQANGNVVYNDKIPVKLGQSGIDKDIISAEAFARGIDALLKFAKICKDHQADRIFAFATSAVRAAKNGTDFTQAVEATSGIKINIIDGNREALFIYEGVKRALRFKKEPFLIIDIGGGSTEILIANSEEVFWFKSYPLGVARLLDKFKPNDPLTSSSIDELTAYFDLKLNELWAQIETYKPEIIVGSSGSFETIHNVCALRFGNKVLGVNQKYSRIYLNEFNIVNKHLLAANVFQRLVIPGMEAQRADTIHIASLFIDYMLKKTNINILLLSAYALKEGVIYSIDQNKGPWQTS